MRSTVRRSLSCLLAVLMLLSIVPAAAASEAADRFSIVGSNMTLGNELVLNFMVNASDIDPSETYTAEVTHNGERVRLPLREYNSRYYCVSYALAAAEMADEITVSITDASGSTVSRPYTRSIMDYARAMLSKSSAESGKLQTLLVDMLDYGTEAQKYFHYHEDVYANSGLTEEQLAMGSSNAAECVNSQVAGKNFHAANLSLVDRILLNMFFSGVEDVTGMYAKVEFEDCLGRHQTAEAEVSAYSAGVCKVAVDEIVLADARQNVTVKVYAADGSLHGEAVDSVESYIARTAASDTDALYGAIMKFSASAYDYLVGGKDDSENGSGAAEGVQISTAVDVNEDGTVKEAVCMAGETVQATVPAGVAVKDGTTSLVLSVSEMNESEADVTVGENETAMSVNVHVDGVAGGNTKAILVNLGEVLPAGLNMGNIALYHVENGGTVEMTRVFTLPELDSHNEFYYDPASGEVTVALASFSEIMMINEDAKWEGEFDYTWYDAAKAELTIANADQLAAFGAVVGGMDGRTADSFAEKTVKLGNDIVIGDTDSENGIVFYPIGYYNSEGTYEKSNTAITSGFKTFEGTFDGNGHTISDFYQNTWEMKGDHDWYAPEDQHYRDGMGLFGKVYGGTVKNLTIKNFSSDGEITTTGCVAAYADCGAIFENIAIFNCNPRVYNIGNGGIVGCVGWYAKETADEPVTFTNITVDNTNKISALWGSYDVACGGIVGQYYPVSGQEGSSVNAGIRFDNCHVAAVMDVYNDVCANYQYYAYRYTGMMIGSIRENETIDGHVYPKMDGITASGCTVHFGDWNDYYYCELVANSLASYTHDHQMSRLTQVASVDTETMTVTDLDGSTTAIPAEGRQNYVVVKAKDANEMWIHGDGKDYAACYHFVNSVQHFHDIADADNPEIYETVDGVEGVLKEDKQLVYREFNQLFTGYGWGVTSKGLTDYEGVTNMDIKAGDNDASVEKFAKADTAKNSYTTGTAVTIGELFAATEAGLAEKTAIREGSVLVSVSPVGDDSTANGTYTANATDWTQGTLTLTGGGTATVTITDYYFCTPTTIEITVIEPEDAVKFDKLFTGDFLYRVGNRNAVTLGTLFEASDAVTGDVTIGSVAVDIETVEGTASGTYESNDTWSAGTIQFSGSGVVKVTVTDNNFCIPTELYLEIVNAKNTTTASFSGDTVLLQDVSADVTLSASGVIYGNGFTVNMENAPITEKNGAIFHLYDGTVLKNLNIVGKEFTTVAANVNDTNYGVSVVRTWGTVVIENCYISGCRAAVSVTGTELTIKDSVIANGIYANVDFRSGILNLHNVTTINEPHPVDDTTVVGLGIVGNMTASAGRQINITGNLSQYNWVSQADCEEIKTGGVSDIFNSVFTEAQYADLRYTYNGTTYVNTGILSLCSDFTDAATAGAPGDYKGMDVTATVSNVSVDGYVWAPAQAGILTDDDMAYHGKALEPITGEQGTSYIPAALDFTGLETENGVLQISYDSGSSYTLKNETLRSIFTAEKYGQSLNYTIEMDGTDYTNSDIVFQETASKSYTIVYTITDDLVYDKDGNKTDKTYEATKELRVFATVADKGADAPIFTFYYGTKGSASAGTPHAAQPTDSYTSKIQKIGDAYYIMPDVSDAAENKIGSRTVDGSTVYYPIVDGINVRSGNSTDYDFTRYYPVFKAVKISDNGTEYTYDGTKEMPATVAWVEAEIDDGNGASALNEGFGLYNEQYLCKIQAKAGNAESGGTSVVKYSYVALDGNTYCYFVGYRFYDEDESEGCVTPDTLVTLADGTKKEIRYVTYEDELLVWDFAEGEYAAMPSIVVRNHGYSDYRVLTLNFSDGTSVDVIAEHGFFDVDTNEFVMIGESNVEEYVGHAFVKGNDELSTVTLDSYDVTEEYTAAYSVLTAVHYNCVLGDMLTLTPNVIGGNYFMPFEVGEDMKFDAEKMQADIETYGLFTYEEFADYVTEEQFYALNAPQVKVAVGKGIITMEQLYEIIATLIPHE